MKCIYKGKIKRYSWPPSECLDPQNQKTRSTSHPCKEKAKKGECWGKTFMEHLQKNSHGWLDKVSNVKRKEIPVSNAPVKTAGRQQD